MAWKTCYRYNLFHNKVAIVTGGGTGIGYKISYELALLGATVVLASRNEKRCHDAACQINESIQNYIKSDEGVNQKDLGTVVLGRAVAGPSTSIRNEDEIKHLVSHIIQTYGSIDLLVNNAGGQFVSPAENISRRGFQSVVETNLLGTFLMCREVYTQYMRDSPHPTSIVNITLDSRNGIPQMAHSGASRSGVENLTRTLCSEWIHSNVRINCVRPGIIWTESGADNYGDAVDLLIETVLPSQPAKRFGSPEEVASAAVWLLSEGSSYVTGAVVCVDGGSSFHFLPLVEIEDEANLSVYGTLPRKAKL